MKTYYEITIIRSQSATERENLEYPSVLQTESIDDSLELSEFTYNSVTIGKETDKELRKVTENESGIVIEDILLESTY